jgi:hypothetical protein
MAILVIGSYALQQHATPTRVANDIDVIGTYEEVCEFFNPGIRQAFYPIADGKKYFIKTTLSDDIIEAEIAWPGSLAEEFLSINPRRQMTSLLEKLVYYATLDDLFTLKMSHRYLRNSPHFEKTRNDIIALRKMGVGPHIPDYLSDWFKRREKATYHYNKPSLDTNKEGFFRDEYVYDHDSIHMAIAYPEPPAYESFKADSAEVLTCNKRFAAAQHYVKLRAGYEESCVLALERSLIPHPGKMTPEQAFKFALQKVCTSITSGPFREFCWENYDGILRLERMLRGSGDAYERRFRRGVENGIVKLADNSHIVEPALPTSNDDESEQERKANAT